MSEQVVTKFDEITLSRGIEECVTIFTSDGPVQVEVGYFKGANNVALRFITPPGMLVLRNELLDEQGNSCHQGKSTSGKSTSTPSAPESTSPLGPLVRSSAKRAADSYQRGSSNDNLATIPQRIGTKA